VARWSTAGKFAGLQKLFGGATLTDLTSQVPRSPKLQVVIPAYDYDRNRAREADVLVRDLPVSTLTSDLKTLATSILADPPDAATFTAFLMMQHDLSTPQNQLRQVRLNPLIQPIWRNHPWEFPDGFRANASGLAPDEFFSRLVALDMDAMVQGDVQLIRELGRLWVGGAEITNQPIRADGGTFAAQVGFGNFTDAKARWPAL
jgi:hypothetical protein